MKIATSLSQQGLTRFITQNNKLCKEQYVINNPNHGLSNYLADKLIDTTDASPVFRYELSSHETKGGTPKYIELDGYEFFNWNEI